MPTAKERLLLATYKLGPRVPRARLLQLESEMDEHSLIHVLYSLNRQGLLAFRLDKRGTVQEPRNIKLTKRGLEAVEQLRRDQP